MLRLRDPQGALWDQLLPPQARTLSAELTAVDECLADDRFFEPYRQRFRTLMGRPTVPVETDLRLMYLKHRYRLGYELLVREVTDIPPSGISPPRSLKDGGSRDRVT